MLTGKKIPFVSENISMRVALKTISQKGLGVLIAKNKLNKTTGILTDGDFKRLSNKIENFHPRILD